MIAQPVSWYVRQIRPSLPSRAFRAVPSRLAWLLLHWVIIGTGIVAIARGWGGWVAAPFLALAIGHSFAGAAFVGHETMHGAVVRATGWRQLVGWICFLPFLLSPRLWVAWHNKTHHAHTMEDGVDPDAYPTLAVYHQSRAARFADRVSLGGGRLLGLLTLALGFTGQSTQMLLRRAATEAVLDARERRLAFAETLAGVALWTALAVAIGARAFAFAFVLPLMVGNAIVMAYILTNHSLSPLTEVNDPLLNTLSVTTPRLVSWLHLDFGLHVEHHLFPSLSSAFAPLVRDALRARWPERYQSLPLGTALARLYRSGRVYATPTRLCDPRSGHESSALLPGDEARARNQRPDAADAAAATVATAAPEAG